LGQKFTADPKYSINILCKDGMQLKYASSTVRASKECVLAASIQKLEALQYHMLQDDELDDVTNQLLQ
jgi:hypothetical protein